VESHSIDRNNQYLRRIEGAFQGEVYGEAMYLEIAAAMTDEDRAFKWRVLARQETQTKEYLRTLIERYGVDCEEHASSRDVGIRDAKAYAAMPWHQLMQRFSRELDPDIAAYRELESNCPPEDVDVLRRLTRHEVLTKQFCDLELEGKHEISIEAVIEFLRESAN
jgi:hypothetical protein